MDCINCRIHSINAGENTISFQCTFGMEYLGKETAVQVFELEPFENREDIAGRTPAERLLYTCHNSGLQELVISRFDNKRDRLYSKFVLCAYDSEGTGKRVFDGPCHVTSLDFASLNSFTYPQAKSIKGLQVKMTDDALKLGINHAALNLNQPNIMLPCAGEDTITYMMDGEEFYFNARYLYEFDRRVKELSDHGIIVNLILLNSMRWDGEHIHPYMEHILVHPDYNSEGFISAFNTVTPEGLKYFKAFVEFAVGRYTRPDQIYGRACGFIIGNEVDSQWVWCNAGEKTAEKYMEEYSVTSETSAGIQLPGLESTRLQSRSDNHSRHKSRSPCSAYGPHQQMPPHISSTPPPYMESLVLHGRA